MAHESNISNNIKDWLKTHILDFADTNKVEGLIVELKFLIDILPKQYRLELHSECHVLFEWIKTNSINSTLTELEKLEIYKNGINHKIFLKNIKKPHQNMKELYLITFLVNRAESSKVNVIRALYFFLCLRMTVLTDYDSRIETTLDECRFLTNKTREFLIPFLPDVNEYSSMQDLLSAFESVQSENLYEEWLKSDDKELEVFVEKIRRKLHQDEKDQEWTDNELVNYRLCKHLYEFILPLENILLKKSGITRNISRSGKPTVISSDTFVDEATGDSTSTIYSVNIIPNENQTLETFEADERQDDDIEAVFEVSLDRPISYHLDIVNAQQQVNMRRKRSMLLNTDVQVAKSSEIKILFNELFIVLENCNVDYSTNSNTTNKLTIEEMEAVYILMTLLTGSSEYIQYNGINKRNEYYDRHCIEFNFSPARSVLDRQYSSDLSAVSSDKLELTLPIAVAVLIKNMEKYIVGTKREKKRFFSELEKLSENRVRKINKKNNIRLSLNKLRTYLKHVLFHSGTDTAVVDIITLSPIHHLSALPYFSITKADIYYAQYHYYDHLKEILFLEPRVSLEKKLIDNNKLSKVDLVNFPDDRHIYKAGLLMGTKLALLSSKIKSELVLPIINELKTLRSYKDFTIINFIDFHNKLMDYLYIMLGLSSGYRPVIETFGRLKDIDIDTGMYFISDKENRMNAQGRFIILPEIVRLQLRYYQSYLYKNMKLFNVKHYQLGKLIQAVYESSVGLIIYLEVNEYGEFNFVKNQNNTFISNRFKLYAHLPLNWYRHHIRSLKDSNHSIFSSNLAQLNDEVVSSWMGHTDQLGFDYYDTFSGLKRSQQAELAELIDKKLKEYGFEPIELNEAKNVKE
ncbi:hypothetical protein [Psychrobacter maritimus]|uniref:hypothetical protein n=1 Tax=Psychrobacter maritimus TaxID=256325 RepID=UPI00191AA833|nr:hypothetical protein [Psychrobacter maritimus]